MKLVVLFLLMFICATSFGQIVETDSKDTVGLVKVVEKEAAYNDTIIPFHMFLQRNLRIPKAWVSSFPNNQISATETVEIQFIVCKDGSVCEIKALHNPSQALATEGIRIIQKSSGKWKPAEQGGNQVKSYFRQRITFVYEAE